MFEFKRAAAAAGRRFSRLFSAFLTRRAVMPLLYANDRMLRDIGLSRVDIVDSLSGPLYADPSRLLIARINERRGSSKPLHAQPQAAAAANDAKSCPPAQPRSLAA